MLLFSAHIPHIHQFYQYKCLSLSVSCEKEVAKRITIVLDMQCMLLFHFGPGKTASRAVHTSFSMQRKYLEFEHCTKLCAIFFCVFILLGVLSFCLAVEALFVVLLFQDRRIKSRV